MGTVPSRPPRGCLVALAAAWPPGRSGLRLRVDIGVAMRRIPVFAIAVGLAVACLAVAGSPVVESAGAASVPATVGLVLNYR